MRLQRVALEVAPATQQVTLGLDRRAFEASLPQMADEAILPIEVMYIGAQQPGHERRQVATVAHLHEQVKMIAHQAIMVNSQLVALPIAVHQLQEITAVVVRCENRLAVMAAVDQMVTSGLGPLQAAWLARHDGLWCKALADWQPSH